MRAVSSSAVIGWLPFAGVSTGGSDGVADRSGIEAATHEEHAEALERLGLCRQRSSAEMPHEGVTGTLLLIGGQRFVLRPAIGIPVLGSVDVEHLASHAAGAEFRLEQAATPGSVTITLLSPPACERGVVDVSEGAKPFQRRLDHFGSRAGALKPSLNLPAATRASSQEPSGDLEGRRGIGRVSAPL